MSLFDFEQLSTLDITVMQSVQHPEPGRTEEVGSIGTWNNGSCYLSPRTKSEHFFRNLKGYAISSAILEPVVLDGGIGTVFIAERETGKMFEFGADQFERGETLDFDGFDKQKLVPVSEARRVWDKENVEIQ